MTPIDRTRCDASACDLGALNPRLIEDLTHIYREAEAPPRVDAAVRAAVLEHTGSRTAPARAQRLRRPAARGTRFAGIAALVGTVLLAGSGAANIFFAGGPTPVSAQIVLRNAAARALAPNQAAHIVAAVTMTVDGHTATGSADVWLRTDAAGAPTLSAQTLSLMSPKLGADGARSAASSSRYVQIGQELLAYNPEMRGDNMILLSSATQTRGYASWVIPNDAFDGAGAAQVASTLARQSPGSVRLLPQQKLDGVSVDVVEVDGWLNRPAQRTILYFDAQTYALRGFDASSLAPWYPMPSWTLRVNSYTTMPAGAAPTGAFALDAPASATIMLPDLGGPAAVAFQDAIRATCGTTDTAKGLLRSGQSILATCQATAPSVTAATLAGALAAPDKAALDAAAAAGVLTPAQAAAYLGQAQAQLSAWVMAPRAGADASSGGSPGK